MINNWLLTSLNGLNYQSVLFVDNSPKEWNFAWWYEVFIFITLVDQSTFIYK